MKKVAVVLGTRPELIKLAPIIKELSKREIDYVTIITGQHYSANMWSSFIDELKIPFRNVYSLQVRENTHGKMVGQMLQKLDSALIKEKPDLVIVQGDTNSALAGALSAAKLGIKVAHIEAGVRSFDKRQPEEHNRILIDHLSTYLFPPTPEQFINLKNEGLAPIGNLPQIVGNTIADTIKSVTQIGKIWVGDYGFITFHREENVDNPKVLDEIYAGIKMLAKETGLIYIINLHPRTRKRLTKEQIEDLEMDIGTIIIEPGNYIDSLSMQKHAKVVVTDSGGLVEESCILGTPTVVLRKTTDRPEAVKLGASIIIEDLTAENILKCTKKALELKFEGHPYGEDVTNKILEVLQ